MENNYRNEIAELHRVLDMIKRFTPGHSSSNGDQMLLQIGEKVFKLTLERVAGATEITHSLVNEELVVKPQEKGDTVKQFLKGFDNFENICSSCKFFDHAVGYCNFHDIEVGRNTLSCSNWRYSA